MAVETLRPNAAGDETNIGFQYPGTGAHWDKVDEVEPDGNSTRVYSEVAAWQRDLYHLPASSGNGTINSVTVYATVWGYASNRYAKVALKANSTVDEGSSIPMDETWKLISETWNTNPADSQPWTWADIDALQIGVALWGVGAGGINECRCTQVYVEVDYTPITPKTSSETGGGVDGHKAVAPQSAGESGSGVDALTSLLGILARSDTGLGTDAKLSLAVALIKADAGSGIEALLGRAIVLAELGTGLDTTLKEKTSSDSGTGTDALLGLLDRIFTEYGYGVEASRWGARPLLASESGVGVESSLLRDLGQPKSSSDVGAGIDASTLASLLTRADSGVATEALALLAAMLAGDNGQGVDALVEVTATIKDIITSDTGQGVDEVLSYLRKLGDSGEGEENLHLVGVIGGRMRMKVYQREAFDLKAYTSETGK